MKVVKCLEHIPKEIRGRVVKDDIHIICANTMYQLKPSDTFPLPTQGDKVEVSHNGNDFINIREYRALADSIFICKNEHGKYEVWQYIRPIEVKEEVKATNITFKNVPSGYEVYAVRESIGVYSIKMEKTDES